MVILVQGFQNFRDWREHVDRHNVTTLRYKRLQRTKSQSKLCLITMFFSVILKMQCYVLQSIYPIRMESSVMLHRWNDLVWYKRRSRSLTDSYTDQYQPLNTSDKAKPIICDTKGRSPPRCIFGCHDGKGMIKRPYTPYPIKCMSLTMAIASWWLGNLSNWLISSWFLTSIPN